MLEEQKVAFLFICKNANSAIKTVLMDCPESAGFNPHHRSHFRYVSKEYIHSLPVSEWLKVAIVRHPKPRFESCYRQKVWKPDGLHDGFKHIDEIQWKMPFHEFVKYVYKTPDERSEQHFRGQAYDLYINDHTPVPNIWGRMEDLALDWKRIADTIEGHCGMSLRRELPLINPSKGIYAPVKWNPTLERMIRERYERDYRLLGYED